jgi:UDP-N-acetylglucosamine--N-acetylmuramyl-(pentapeptide) pyrophosphoryl-undecaprenol N-acetylglucosamine transferase
MTARPKTLIAIACGGTGGHLFPGLAVARQLHDRGCDILLFVSPKDVDQEGVRSTRDMEVVTLPAVASGRGRWLRFARGAMCSWRDSACRFARQRPAAVLSMGGFTSAGPVLAGRQVRSALFLHESNTIPGRANRWLARLATQAFVGFPSTAALLRCGRVLHTGTPVRPEFQLLNPGECRARLGLHPQRPVLLVMGGSQGASGINDLVLESLPEFQRRLPQFQFIHLTGSRDQARVEAAYQARQIPAVVRAFCSEMPLVMSAATVAVSRSGASSLAEIAALRLPAVLVPYPHAVDNHQYYNAQALLRADAALVLEQKHADPASLLRLVEPFGDDSPARLRMAVALAAWHCPDAAARVAEAVLQHLDVFRTPLRSADIPAQLRSGEEAMLVK